MSVRWWHILGLVLIGYALGWYAPALGKATLGKVGLTPMS